MVGCTNRHVDGATLEKAFMMAWNAVPGNKGDLLKKWKQQEKGEDLLSAYRAQDFIGIVGNIYRIPAVTVEEKV